MDERGDIARTSHHFALSSLCLFHVPLASIFTQILPKTSFLCHLRAFTVAGFLVAGVFSLCCFLVGLSLSFFISLACCRSVSVWSVCSCFDCLYSCLIVTPSLYGPAVADVAFTLIVGVFSSRRSLVQLRSRVGVSTTFVLGFSKWLYISV